MYTCRYRYGLGLFHEVLPVKGSACSRLEDIASNGTQTSLITLIVLSQGSEFTVMRDLNHSKLTLCPL